MNVWGPLPRRLAGAKQGGAQYAGCPMTIIHSQHSIFNLLLARTTKLLLKNILCFIECEDTRGNRWLLDLVEGAENKSQMPADHVKVDSFFSGKQR